MPDAQRYTFHPLLTQDELQQGVVSVPDLLDRARSLLDAFDGPIDAIAGYWDFPVTMMVPVLCRERGLPSASLQSVVTCEHKYWSRLVQRDVIDEIPGFALLDLSDERAELPRGVEYPVWIKPIKSASSEGAHHVEDDEQLTAAIALERDQVGRMGGPFNDVLDMLDLPPEIARIGTDVCLVEEEATGAQVTVEGYADDGEVEIYGVVDSVTHPGTSSFLRYEYPSTRVPPHIQNYMADVSRRVITAVGLDHSTFNIEYFWDAEAETLTLLEINARHSQSHALLFEMVDGIPNHAFMVDLALGGIRAPSPAGRARSRRRASGCCGPSPAASSIAFRPPRRSPRKETDAHRHRSAERDHGGGAPLDPPARRHSSRRAPVASGVV